MASRTSAVALLLLAWLAQPAAAQGPDSSSTEPAAAADKAPAEVNRLPVDVGRLQRRLKESAEREARGAPTIRFDISVYASAPRIVLIRPEDNVKTGQPRWSAPSHQEMFNIVTPQQFRHMPGISFGSVKRWLEGESKSK